MKGLGKRLLTALVAIPILIFLILLPNWLAFGAVVVVGLGLALWELNNMLLQGETNGFKLLLVFVGLGLLVSLGFLFEPAVLRKAYAYPFSPPGLFLVTFFSSFVMIFFLLARGKTEQQKLAPFGISATFLSLFYLSLFGAHLLFLRKLPSGAGWILLLFVSTWLSDTGGYFFGKLIGGPKLYPSVSPNKTWAGLLGCMVGAIGTCFLVLWLQPVLPKVLPKISWLDALILGSLVSVVGQLGDFCESLLKRAYNVKDSGSLLPGHGGLLDRIDSLVFSAPFVFYYVCWFILGK